MKLEETSKREKALLVSVYLPGTPKEVCEEHLQELELLCDTYGIDTAIKVPCPIKKFDASTCIGKGKLEELCAKAHEMNVDMIVFDDEISPAQQRNLEAVFKKTVMDRTEVILGVFEQRAQTREARLQVEMAKLKYEAPRLKRMWTHLGRQAGTAGGGGSGGGGYLKGEGEKQIEIDRRIIKKKMARLQDELKEVRANRIIQRSSRQRSEIPTFAIIGYTNAGKSTLLKKLTEAEVFIEDKLFATLDTTTRKFTLPNNQDILLIDTVGFIRKLPHNLVAAFRSTLEEAVQADILIHLVDMTHPMAEEQAQTTFEVLKKLSSEEKPIITVLNKIDLNSNSGQIHKLRLIYPKTVQISAKNGEGLDRLLDMMVEELQKRRRVVRLRIPQSDYAVVSEVTREGNILHQDYEENDVLIKVDLPVALAGKLEKYTDQ
ncbi:MAG: GTPase HflX [Chlamydiales bacterium]|nr:GTPase HflX [Chlamydiia bacterium]MCP5508137.1 GTPase HflX [Chlamydiales bacterium]